MGRFSLSIFSKNNILYAKFNMAMDCSAPSILLENLKHVHVIV